MADEKESSEEKEEEKSEDKEEEASDEASSEKELSPIEKAEAANKKGEEVAERLEKANAKTEELKAKEILSGKSEAGAEPEKKVETPIEYKDRVMRGEVEK